jgi:hypothetical protein
MNDIENDPEFKAWKQDVQENLIPKLLDSAITISLVPEGKPDVKYAVELGLSIMLDKPIILVVAPGTKVPAKLVKVADDIIEVDWKGNPAKGQRAIQDAISRFVDKE